MKLIGKRAPVIKRYYNPITDGYDYYATCGKCGKLVGTSPDGEFDEIDDADNFCSNCGTEVNWSEQILFN